VVAASLFVVIPGTLYRALMSSDHDAEIRASVAAHADLGPAYDDAVAEGLVERIGAEIDRRIDARLGQFGATGAPGPFAPPRAAPGFQGPAAPAGAQPGAPTPAGAVPAGPVPGGPVPAGAMPGGGHPGLPGVPPAPAGYQGYQGYFGPALPPGYQLGPPPARPAEVGARNVATTITALGSIGLGVATTAIVAHASFGGQGLILLFIWAAIAVINIAYARRP
jgi:hypothetical protein